MYEKLTLVKKSPAWQALERSIPGLERSTGEGIGNLLQYSWASLVTQLIKNPPAMCQTWVRFLGCEDPLEEVNATHSSILAWRIPWTIWSQRVEHDWATYTLMYEKKGKKKNRKSKRKEGPLGQSLSGTEDKSLDRAEGGLYSEADFTFPYCGKLVSAQREVGEIRFSISFQ